MAKKKTTEYKRENTSVDMDRPLTEQEVRAIISNELIFFREPSTLSGGSIQSSNYTDSTGFKIGGDGITLRELLAGSDPSIQGWGNTMTFSAIDADTVSWTAGTVTLTDGSIYNIDTGNTGNMSALTYIYFDANVSLTALQTTTTQATAVGRGKILVAVAQNNSVITSEATFQVFGGSGGLLLTASNIAANTITANEIAANTITASQMNVSQLSAISANMGTITAGTITGATIQTAATGRRTVMSSTNGIQFLNGASQEGYMYNDGSGQMVIDADVSVVIAADGADDFVQLIGDDIFLFAGNDIFVSADDTVSIEFNEDGGTGICQIVNDDTQHTRFEDDGDLYIVNGDAWFDDYFTYDYAEYFEATEEFASEKIPIGTSMVFENGKTRPAKIGEIPFGVVSEGSFAHPGGAGSKEWKGKYLRDELGRLITEKKEKWYFKETPKKIKGIKNRENKDKKIISNWVDIETAPKGATIKIKERNIISPDYDENKEYIPRKDRPEWNDIGLIGQVPILKGQPTNPNWTKIKELSAKYDLWLIK